MPSFAAFLQVKMKDVWTHLFSREKQALLWCFAFLSTNKIIKNDNQREKETQEFVTHMPLQTENPDFSFDPSKHYFFIQVFLGIPCYADIILWFPVVSLSKIY